ncbi:MAG: hypothetical protein ACM3WU_00255 [Bacillota bacterium]
MQLDSLRQSYDKALSRLASILGLEYGEIQRFIGDLADAAWGAQRMKELFKAPDVQEQLDSILKISEEYRCLVGLQSDAACR